MLRKITAIFLIPVLLTTSFSRLYLYAGFTLNRDYIAKVLCINKEKPKMNCKGKCYLTKKVKQAEENEKKEEQSKPQNRVQEALPPAIVSLSERYYFLMTTYASRRLVQLPAAQFAVFHPPQA